VLAISPQDVDSHARWIEQERFPFVLLADPAMQVVDAYGLRAPGVGVRRSVFVIDTTGTIRYRLTAGIRAIFKRPGALAREIDRMG
jgi:peroxiredoxin Q/BCP